MCFYFGLSGKKEIKELLKTMKKRTKQSSKLSCLSFGSGLECTKVVALFPCYTSLSSGALSKVEELFFVLSLCFVWPFGAFVYVYIFVHPFIRHY